MNTVYIISKYITIIGSMLKGFWEHLFCRMLAVPVQDARYLQTTELCGHVEHDFTKSKAVTFLICYLPGMMNRIFGYGMLISGLLGILYVEPAVKTIAFWIYIVMLYLGVSLMCNNAPLYEDALNNWDLFYGKGNTSNIIVKIFAFIPSVYFIISAWMEKYAISFLIYLVIIVLGIVF